MMNRRRWTGRGLASALAAASMLAAGGCAAPSAWRAADAEDIEQLQRVGVETDGRDLVRRDVTVFFLFIPASGYPEWGERAADGSIEVIDTKRRKPAEPEEDA
jgi:hypothetical protein